MLAFLSILNNSHAESFNPSPALLASDDIHGHMFPICLKAARGIPDQIQTVRACSEEAKISRIYVSGWSNLLAIRFQQELHLQKKNLGQGKGYNSFIRIPSPFSHSINPFTILLFPHISEH